MILCVASPVARYQPSAVNKAIAQHDGNEDAGDAIGKLLNGGFLALRVGDELDDLGKRGVVADLSGLDAEGTTQIERSAEDIIAGSLADGHALTGQHGFIDG